MAKITSVLLCSAFLWTTACHKQEENTELPVINASGGGVALVRIKDGKAGFYAYVGKNPHSSELLPDGNIVTASSMDSRLVIFHVDTTVPPNKVYKKIISMPFAHNVVWDKKRKVLWAAGDDHLYKLQYNFNQRIPRGLPRGKEEESLKT